MIETRRRRVTGCAIAWTKAGSVIAFPPEEFPALKSAWMAGRAFYEGHDYHGDELVVRLGDVVKVRFYSSLSMARAREEDRLDGIDDRRDEMLTPG